VADEAAPEDPIWHESMQENALSASPWPPGFAKLGEATIINPENIMIRNLDAFIKIHRLTSSPQMPVK
jgi:hypothetical protein